LSAAGPVCRFEARTTQNDASSIEPFLTVRVLTGAVPKYNESQGEKSSCERHRFLRVLATSVWRRLSAFGPFASARRYSVNPKLIILDHPASGDSMPTELLRAGRLSAGRGDRRRACARQHFNNRPNLQGRHDDRQVTRADLSAPGAPRLLYQATCRASDVPRVLRLIRHRGMCRYRRERPPLSAKVPLQ